MQNITNSHPNDLGSGVYSRFRDMLYTYMFISAFNSKGKELLPGGDACSRACLLLGSILKF